MPTLGAFTKKMTQEEIDGYADRNERLGELCGETEQTSLNLAKPRVEIPATRQLLSAECRAHAEHP